MSKVFSFRVEDGLAEWVDAYAKERGVSRQEVLASAIRSLREDSERSVPDLAREDSDKRMVPAAPAVRTARAFMRDPDAMARQEKLNKARYG